MNSIFCTKAKDGTILWNGVPLRQALTDLGANFTDEEWDIFLTAQGLHEKPATEEEENEYFNRYVEHLVTLTSKD